MPREFSVGWWETLARAIFGYQRHEPLQLEDAVRAVAVFESERAEYGYLKNELRFWTPNVTQTLVAGEFAFVGLSNPLDSGVLAIVEGFIHNSGNDRDQIVGLLDATFSPAIAATAKSGVCTDTRFFGKPGVGEPVPACNHIRGTATAAELTTHTRHGRWGSENVAGRAGQLTTAMSRPRSAIAVLGPGGFIAWLAQAVGDNAEGNILWRERPLWKGDRA